MNFGLHYPSWRFNNSRSQIFDDVKATVQWAESSGFSWFSVMDHLIQIDGIGPEDEPMMESWTILSALATVTQKMRLATLVTSVSYRNPAVLAKMAATVDVISNGRLTLGIGVGWYQEECRQYGYTFPATAARRIDQLAEAIQLIKALWLRKRATFQGDYFSITDAILEPKPVQQPHPPILIGGGGESLTLKLVALQANMTNVFGSPERVKHKFDVLR